jgi:hypothetical protein
LNENGVKWSKKKKIRREVRENKSFNENIEDRSARNMNRGKHSKRKKSSTSALEHLVEKTEK